MRCRCAGLNNVNPTATNRLRLFVARVTAYSQDAVAAVSLIMPKADITNY